MRELERDLPSPSAAAQRAVLPAFAVVGAGRVGSSIAAAAERAGLDVRLAGRAEAIDACREVEAVLLCVADEAIAPAAEAIAAAGPRLRFAGHTSGASGLDALAPLTAAGAAAFSLHPLQTVPDAATDFTGCPCAISGAGEEALGLARALAERLGMRPFEIAEERRAAYHAAASIASNFLVALEESAAGLLAEAGAPDARELLAPLVLRTAANWSERGAAALTGPIARGDEATVGRHLEALRETAPELVPLYEALAERTRELARRQGSR
ncbi:MAG: hypothetical protein QOI10_1938 [Solirubrobacterales bacterium]|jgi:predicted short-subunit dehydrogenase-like oxidoreductase (DUF2520 family)|nr:hypothetical protein [Solirubrobacterales bacterium]